MPDATRCPTGLGDAVAWAAGLFRAAGIDSPQLDAEVLAAYILDEDRTFVIAHPEAMFSERQQWLFAIAVERRSERVPLPYLTGRVEFLSLAFAVTPQCLIPRPETEHLVETVEACVRFTDDRPVIGADIGTGSGAVAVALAVRHPQCVVYAIDCDVEALAVAERNIAAHGVGDRVKALAGMLLAPLATVGLTQRLDFIAANLPYVGEAEWGVVAPEVRYEPRHAVIAGTDPLALIREMVADAATYLAPDGWLCLEMGAGQADAVVTLLKDAGHRDTRIVRDLAGIDRVVAARAKRFDA